MIREDADRTAADEAGPERLRREDFGLETGYAAPATATERGLVEIWEEVLEIDGIGAEDDYFRLGGDSVAAVTLFTEVERRFGRILLPSTLLDCPTVRSIAALLDGPARPEAERPLVAVRAEGRRPPLFVAHTIFGDVLFVSKFLPYVPADTPVYAIEARGLDGRDPPHDRFEAMAADFVGLLRRLQPAGPYFLAGLCDGSLTAVEMARILRGSGEEVAFVGLIDPRVNPLEAPYLHWADPDAPLARLQRRARRKWGHLSRWIGARLGRRSAGNAVPAPVDGPEMARRRQGIRAGMTAALASYRPRPYEGPVSIFATADHFDLMRRCKPGWGALARRPEVIRVDSSHAEVMFEGLPKLGEALRAALERAQGALPLSRAA